MLKRKPRRSREHKKNSQVIDLEEAREKRRQEREQRLAKVEAKQRIEEAKKPSVRKKKQIRKRRLIYCACIAFVLAILVYCCYDIVVLHIEKEALIKEQQALLEKKETLEQEYKNVNDPKYIEQQARLQLRLVMPGETLFILPEPSEYNENKEEIIDDKKGE